MITMKSDSNVPVNFPIRYAQRFFLQKAVTLKPEIIDDLRDTANIEYSIFSLSVQLNRCRFNLNQLTPNNMFVETPLFKAPHWTDLTHTLNAVKLKQALLSWADRWNIKAEWCLDYGLRFLNRTYHSQINHQVFGEQNHISSNCKQTDRELLFTDGIEDILSIEFLEIILKSHGNLPLPPHGWPEWNPIREKRQAYIYCIKQEVSKAIESTPYLAALNKGIKRGLINSALNIAEQYCKKLEECMRQAKIQFIKLSRNIERNLLWAVKFQVAGMTYSAIADEYRITQKPKSRQTAKRGVSEDVAITTVKRSVEQTLKLLGLRKRSNSGPGRPRHAKDSRSAQITKRLGLN